MFLPGNEDAILDIAKLRDYCLNPNHPVGKHKAKVFASALGFTADDAERLKQMLLRAAQTEQAVPKEKDQYGQRYQIDFAVDVPILDQFGEIAISVVLVRSAWIVLLQEDMPRFVSCRVLEGGKDESKH